MLYAQAQIPLRHWLAYSATSHLRPPSFAGGRRRGGGVRGAARSREHATTEGAAGATTSAIASSSAVAGASGQRELLMARRDLVTCSTECFIGRRPRAGNTTVHSLQRAACKFVSSLSICYLRSALHTWFQFQPLERVRVEYHECMTLLHTSA